MHELSLAGGIVKLVEDAAAREHFRRVSQLRLEAGALAGVEVRALRFALEAVAPGTCLEGATHRHRRAAGHRLVPALRARASRSRSRTDPCPRCGGYQIQPTGGTELRVLDLLVHDD